MMAIAEDRDRRLSDLMGQIGGVPLTRIALYPAPGTAAEDDVTERVGEHRLYELVDAVLVEKGMGYYESLLAMVLGRLLGNFVEEHDLGIVLGADAMLRLKPGLIRMPDVCFFSWDHFPDRGLPDGLVLDGGPDLAVEILSPTNTEAEMQRKLREYFDAGARLVWYVHPAERSVDVYRSPGDVKRLTGADSLDGDPVLPGFRLSIQEWFQRTGRRQSD